METILQFLQAHIVDVVLIAIILIWATIKAVQGLYKSLMAVVVLVLAIVAGLVLSRMAVQPVGEFVWQKYGPTIEERFDEEFGSAIAGGENALNGFKDSWNNLLESTGISQINSLISTLGGGNAAPEGTENDVPGTEGTETESLPSNQTPENTALAQKTFAEKIKETVMTNARSICFKVVHVILFIVIALLALLVLSLLKDWLQGITELPVVGQMDHLLGFLLGFAEAVIVILFIVRLAGLIGIDVFKDLAKDSVIMQLFVGGEYDSGLISSWFDQT